MLRHNGFGLMQKGGGMGEIKVRDCTLNYLLIGKKQMEVNKL